MNTSLASILASEPDASRQRMLDSLSEAEAEALLYDWRFWARPSQCEPPGDWGIFFLKAGRGYGKTRAGCEWILEKVKSSPTPVRIALVAKTPADARDVMVTGESGLIAKSPPWFKPIYESSKRRVVWPNGSIATLYSSYKYDTLRGPAHHYAWCDEVASWRFPQATWDMLMFGLRLGDNPRCVVTSTPRPIPLIKDLLAREGKDVAVTHGSTYDNRSNLPPAFFNRVIARYAGTALGAQEIEGLIIGDTPGALWTRAILEKTRVAKYPELVRVVIGVDPQGTKSRTATADGDLEPPAHETGIVAAGLGEDGHGYVLDDASLNGLPHEWGQNVVACYNRLRADLVCGESNFGGDMVESTIRTVDPLISFKPVVASRGKYIRAEPISSLYYRGMIHHVGMFGELEDELCLSGDTGIITRDGPRALAEVVDQEVIVLGGDGEWHCATGHYFGKAHTQRLILSHYGTETAVTSTDQHRWFTDKTGGKAKFHDRNICETRTRDLTIGDKLIGRTRRSLLSHVHLDPVGVMAGFVFGDGWLDVSGCGIAFYDHDRELIPWFGQDAQARLRPHKNDCGTPFDKLYGLPRFLKRPPDFSESASFLYGWLAGYFAADGHMARNSQATISSASRSDLEIARHVCTLLGIQTYAIRSAARGAGGCVSEKYRGNPMYQFGIGTGSLRADFFLKSYHRENWRVSGDHLRRTAPIRWAVESIDPGPTQDIYCLNVPDDGRFVLADNHIISGNCSWVPGARSPNRLDSSVIALTELMSGGRPAGDLGISF